MEILDDLLEESGFGAENGAGTGEGGDLKLGEIFPADEGFILIIGVIVDSNFVIKSFGLAGIDKIVTGTDGVESDVGGGLGVKTKFGFPPNGLTGIFEGNLTDIFITGENDKR